MPELPEVETIVRDLGRSKLVGRRIQEVRVFWKRTIAEPGAEAFQHAVAGREVAEVFRRGKMIGLKLRPSGTVLIHLRMSGRLDLFKTAEPLDPYVRAAFVLKDGWELRFKDIRKFGKFYFFQNPEKFLSRLGPEPLERCFTPQVLSERLRGRHRQMKALLLDQSFVAGLGNIYADEALWDARIHPALSSSQLSQRQIEALHQGIVKVLQSGVKHAGTTLGTNELNYYSLSHRRGRNQDALKVFRRTGEPCPNCKTAIVRTVIAQRSTHFCPQCQKKK